MEDPAVELFKIMLSRQTDPEVRAEIQEAIDELQSENQEALCEAV